MAAKFTHFAILGAMRTGSNFLEASLSQLDGVTTYGEVFNPLFIGQEGQSSLFGIDLVARARKPERLLERILEETPGLAGFRFFQDHDPRILRAVLRDPACAKIVLTRNPLDSFVSFQIALRTGEWVVTGDRAPARARVQFKPHAFKLFCEELEAFYATVRRGLQTHGQTAFSIDYDELNHTAVLNGLAGWLGLEARLKAPSSRLRRQNPAELGEKVENVGAVATALATFDPFALRRIARPEPLRLSPYMVMVSAPSASLLYLPVKAGPEAPVRTWLAKLDRKPLTALGQAFTPVSFREWQVAHPGHRSFTVLRHPLERAHAALCTHLLMPGPQRFGKVRGLLRDHYGLDFPGSEFGADYDRVRHRQLLLDFLTFVRRNVAGMTSIRVDAAWATQEATLRTFSAVRPPDMILREEALQEGLALIAASIGRKPPALPRPERLNWPFTLAEVYDGEVEAAARLAYGRDYEVFGFSDWKPLTPP